jgi:hypothetical protein
MCRDPTCNKLEGPIINKIIENNCKHISCNSILPIDTGEQEKYKANKENDN